MELAKDSHLERRIDIQQPNLSMGKAIQLEKAVEIVKSSVKTPNCITFGQRIHTNVGSVLGGLFDTAESCPNFDYHCNPSGAESEVIVCEMIRKQAGLSQSYSLSTRGLGKFMPCIDEAVLLAYQSSTHSAEGQRLSVHHNGCVPQKAMLLANCDLSVHVPVKDGCLDVDALAATQAESCHFIMWRVDSAETLAKEYRAACEASQRCKASLFLDLTLLGIQALRPGLCEGVEADFVLLHLAEVTYLSGDVLFMKERQAFSKSIVMPLDEFRKFGGVVTQQQDCSKDRLLTQVDIQAHEYIIGFGNYLSWYRFLFYSRVKGKSGIAADIANQQQNGQSVAKALIDLPFVKQASAVDRTVRVALSCSAADLSTIFQGQTGAQPFVVSRDLAMLYMPIDLVPESEIQGFVDQVVIAHSRMACSI